MPGYRSNQSPLGAPLLTRGNRATVFGDQTYDPIRSNLDPFTAPSLTSKPIGSKLAPIDFSGIDESNVPGDDRLIGGVDDWLEGMGPEKTGRDDRWLPVAMNIQKPTIPKIIDTPLPTATTILEPNQPKIIEGDDVLDAGGFGVRPSNELEDLIGGAYSDLIQGNNPVYEQNQRAAMTHLSRQKREIDAELSRAAAQMGITPGSPEYESLRNRMMESHISGGSEIMSGLATQNMQATQAALGQAGQFLGQQQRYGMDYGKFAYQRMAEDRTYAENIRRWDANWEENNRRYGQERADKMSADKIAQLQKTMMYNEYLSPGQFSEVKGELAELLGISGGGWDDPEKTQIEYLREQYEDMGYTREEAEAKLNEAKMLGLLDPLGGLKELRDQTLDTDEGKENEDPLGWSSSLRKALQERYPQVFGNSGEESGKTSPVLWGSADELTNPNKRLEILKSEDLYESLI